MKDDFLSSIIEAMPDAVLVMSEDFTILAANRGARQLMVKRGQGADTAKCHKLLHNTDEPCDGLEMKCPLAQAVSTGVAVTVNHGHCVGEADGRTYEAHVAAFSEEPGKPLRYMMTCRDITDSKRAAELLEQRERKFSAVFNNTFGFTGVLTPEGVLFEANQTALDFAGLQPSDVLGKPLWETPWWAHSQEQRWRLQAAIKQAAAGELVRFETTNLAPDGTIVYFDASLKPVLDDENNVQYLIIEGRDVTDHKHADEAIKKGVANQRATLEATADGILAVGVDENVLFSNKRFAELWRIPQPLIDNGDDSVLIRHVLAQLVDPDAFVTEIQHAYGSDENSCDTLHCKDGRVIERYSFPLWQDESAPSGRVWSFRDVTERKQAEDALRRLKSYLSNIIDSMPSVLVGVDADGKVTQYNSEARRVTGLGSDAALGRPLVQVLPHLAAEMGRVHEAIRTRKAQPGVRRARQEDGMTRYEYVTIYPLVANGVEGAVIRVDDVTERVRIEEMMVQSEKMLSVGGLAAGMAHEINNPLGGMIQNAEVMIGRLTASALPANIRAAEEAGTTMEAIQIYLQKRKIIDILRRIRESGVRAAEIVANMLSFARKGDSPRSSHNLASLLEQSVALASTDYDLKKKYDFRRIEIVREYDDDLPLVPCESGKIQLVFLNILRNGAEAMQQDPRFVLRLAHEREKRRVRVEIEDNGPGMDEGIRRRVFEPFYTTKPTGSGTGLGLSVSYFIISEDHGGEMSVESTPGRGTKFIISLPVEESPPSPESGRGSRATSGLGQNDAGA